jgi:HAE1 family hydrophobic/amphiphilic exporter-1
MQELTGAVIATSLVLMAVFIPVAFFPGTTGALYRQFALTIAFAIALSTFNALTLTPTLSGLLLRANPNPWGDGWDDFDRTFNQWLDWLRDRYRSTLESLNHMKPLVLAGFVALLVVTGWLYRIRALGLFARGRSGLLHHHRSSTRGVSLNYTSDVMGRVEEDILELPGVRATFAVGGFGFGSDTVNNGVIFTTLIPWSERGPGQSAQALIGQLFGGCPNYRGAVFPVNPPPIQGLGQFGGFQYQLQDRQGNLRLIPWCKKWGKCWGRQPKPQPPECVQHVLRCDPAVID